MTAKIIDGTALSAKLRGDIAAAVASLKRERQVVPGLATILVGEDPASRVYVANKGRQTREAGMNSFDHRLPAETSQQALLKLIDTLNADDAVDGILVQLPLPVHIDAAAVLERIDPAKDVDGFHPINVGRLASGAAGLVPCTPVGAMMLIRSVRPDLSGCDALVLGRSNIVGKPMAQLLLAANATVTIAHSRTRNLPDLCRRADILVAAIGRPAFVRGDWIKAGAIVIDVGINRVPDPDSPDGKSRLVGDVAFAEAAERAEAITPVPGGVGPMTIACLLHNTLKAARARRNLPAT